MCQVKKVLAGPCVGTRRFLSFLAVVGAAEFKMIEFM